MRDSLRLLALWLCLLGLLPAASHAAEPLALPLLRPWTGDYDAMAERRFIRVLVPYSKTIYFLDRGREFGTAVESGRALDQWINRHHQKELERIHVAYVPVARDDLIPALLEGRGDVIFANLTITPERQERIAFTVPMASGVSEVLVTGPDAPGISSLEDLGGQPLHVRRSSSYYEHLANLNASFRASGLPEIELVEADENLEDEDLLEMVNAGLLPWAVADRFKARIWAQVFDQLTVREDIAISTGQDIALGIRPNSPQLKAMLDGFVKQHRTGTSFGNILRQRYYRDDKMVRRAYATADLARFHALLLLFQTYADSYHFDPLLLAAQGYQESQLDQSRRSPRGAVGIMQLLPSTAADPAVNVRGIAESAERNIEAGSKYLHHLHHNYVTGDDIRPLDRMLLSLAAYNAGPGNLNRFRRTARQMGLDPNVWFGNVEHAAARIVGRETVQYVANIYRYYLAYAMYLERMRVRQQGTAETADTAGAGPLAATLKEAARTTPDQLEAAKPEAEALVTAVELVDGPTQELPGP